MSDSKESSSTNSINTNEGNNDVSPEGLVDRFAQYNVEVTKDNTDNLNLNVMKKIKRNSKIFAKELKNWEDKLKEKSDEHEISLKEIKDKNAEIEKMKLAITSLENKHTMETQELKEEVKKALAEIDDLKKRLQEKSDEHEISLKEIKDKNAEMDKMKLAITSLENKNSFSTTSTFSGSINNIYYGCKDISDDSCTKKLKETELLLQQKIIENKNLEKQLQSLSGTIEANQKEIQSLCKKNEELQNKIDELKCVSETRPL